MGYIYIGNFVNTHGIKGELRILSDFEEKDLIFGINKKIYVGSQKKEFIIESYRKHKNFDMVVLNGIYNINDAINLKGEKVYVKREDISYDGVLIEDLIGYEAYINDKKIGIITRIMKSKAHPILVINGLKEFLVPYVDEFIKVIDSENKLIKIENINGLIDED